MAVDIKGKEVNVGDTIIFTTYEGLAQGTIIKRTASGFKIQGDESYRWERFINEYYTDKKVYVIKTKQ